MSKAKMRVAVYRFWNPSASSIEKSVMVLQEWRGRLPQKPTVRPTPDLKNVNCPFMRDAPMPEP